MPLFTARSCTDLAVRFNISSRNKPSFYSSLHEVKSLIHHIHLNPHICQVCSERIPRSGLVSISVPSKSNNNIRLDFISISCTISFSFFKLAFLNLSRNQAEHTIFVLNLHNIINRILIITDIPTQRRQYITEVNTSIFLTLFI